MVGGMMMIGEGEVSNKEIMTGDHRHRHLKRIHGHQMIPKELIRDGDGGTTRVVAVAAAAEVMVVIAVGGEIGFRHIA